MLPGVQLAAPKEAWGNPAMNSCLEFGKPFCRFFGQLFDLFQNFVHQVVQVIQVTGLGANTALFEIFGYLIVK